MSFNDNLGLGVVRIKPLGAGGGGGERSAYNGQSSIRYNANGKPSVAILDKVYNFPKMVIPPSASQEALFNQFMPSRIEGFLDGFNVNVMAYGQTGSGKTHTMFGPPGILRKAALGQFGVDITPDYGLFPRGMITIFNMLNNVRAANPGKTYVLTCSAVELGAMGNEDMFSKTYDPNVQRQFNNAMYGIAGGVALNNAETPPKLYGMTQKILKTKKDLLACFGALSTRNTAGTQMNDSSSRSPCFAFLTLYMHDKATDHVRTTRFQFCDLAGSERMKNAHGTHSWKDGGMEAINGLATNYSLMMLGQCVVDLVSQSKKGKKIRAFRAYKVDLIPLLSESLSGDALTAVFICISQAMANAPQSKFSMILGENFSKLTINRKRVKSKPMGNMLQELKKDFNANKSYLNQANPTNKYHAFRKARAFECVQILEVLKLIKNDNLGENNGSGSNNNNNSGCKKPASSSGIGGGKRKY